MIGTDGDTTRYRVVSGCELVWARTGSALALVLSASFSLLLLGALLDPRNGTVATVLLGVAGVAGLVLLVRVATWLPGAWRPDPLLVVDRDGVQVRVCHDGGRGRRVRLPWAEVTGLAVAPGPPEPAEPRPGTVVAEHLAHERARGRSAEHRWGSDPARSVVVVSVAAGSGAQAAEFRRAADAVRARVEATRGDPHRPAERFAALLDRLEGWQREWAGSAQPVGFQLAVRASALDVERLDAAVRACAPGRSVRQLPGLRQDELDTPHGVALLLDRAARYDLSSD